MKIITHEDINKLKISSLAFLEWIDFPLRNREVFNLPTKVRIPLAGSDYCNIMPCALPSENVFGIKVINRDEKRRSQGKLNMDSQILLYSYDTCDFLCLMDGNLITAMRTAAVAVHSVLNMVESFDIIALLGLGNIGTAIGEMLFSATKEMQYTVKLFKYKNQADIFIERFKRFSNITFQIYDTYTELMEDSDLIISCVSYASNDFCSPDIYKTGCTIIPVHMRGFMECDPVFDNIIVSDLTRAEGFQYYDRFRKLTYTDDILKGTRQARQKKEDRIIIYNLGLSITDIYFAYRIYNMMNDQPIIELLPNKKLYV